jgi:TolB-like protein/Flp pilus assembly protein TadD
LLEVGSVLATVLVAFVAFASGRWRERPANATPRRSIQSLAVLPLKNLSRDPEQEYFADGMTEALISNLGKISNLRVTSRTSVMRYRDAPMPLPDIARTLKVDAIVEGAVQRAGDRIRISVQLIEAATDRQIWSASYERDARDVLALESEVAQAVAGEIRVNVAPQEQARLVNTHRISPDAYESYLKGRFFWNKRTEADLRKSIEYFNAAIGQDPTWPLAYVGVADAYSLLGFGVHAVLDPRDAMPKARAAAQRALQLDDTAAEAHTTLGFVLGFYDWDKAGAEREYERAIELDAAYPVLHQRYALHLAMIGQNEKALREAGRARDLDPLSLIITHNIGWVLTYRREFDRALEAYRRVLDIDQGFLQSRAGLGRVFVFQSKFEQGIEEEKTVLQLNPRFIDAKSVLG